MPVGTSQGSICESTVSDEARRKRRRSHTATAEGDDYVAREFDFSQEPGTEAVLDEIRNGKKVAVRPLYPRFKNES
jgi:hypothetical protein